MRRLAGKGGLDRRGALPPGEHGSRRRRQPSTFALQLRAKQLLKRMYGVRERQFRRYLHEAQASRDRTGDRLVFALERRLDNVLYRLGFATTRAQARQFVNHGHVFVDGPAGRHPVLPRQARRGHRPPRRQPGPRDGGRVG
jgi:small subunit ribosomal protein S4